MSIKFKYEKDITRSWLMHPRCLLILTSMYVYCQNKQLPFVVTATVTTEEEDKKIGRKSDTHRTGRAFDISVQGWQPMDVDLFIMKFTSEFGGYGAVNESGKPVLIPDVNHGTAPHIHVQLHRRFAVTYSSEVLNEI